MAPPPLPVASAPGPAPTPEQAEEHATKLMAQYILIEARPLTTLQHCEDLFGLDGVWPCTRWVPDTCAELVAAFLDSLADWSDCTIGGTYSEKLHACRAILADAQGLQASGITILFGIYRTDEKFRVLAMTFLPQSDVQTHHVRQLMVPRSFLAGMRGEIGR
jgi:hypothetical protein